MLTHMRRCARSLTHKTGPRHGLVRFDEADGALWNVTSILARADVFNEGSFFGLPYKDGLNIPETPWWYPNVPAVMRTDRRGNPVAVNETWLRGGWGIHRSGCTLANEWNAFKCHSGASYRRVVIESMDPDHEIRRVSPVALSSSDGYTDLLNGQMDHGWCFSYTCLRRLMTFAAPVAMGTEYTVHFAATNPQKMRITLAHAAAGEKLIMKIYYQTSQRLNIFVGDKFVEDVNMLEGQMRQQLVRNGQLTCNCEDCSGDKQAGKKSACYDRQVLHMQTPCKLVNAGGVPRDGTLGVMCHNSGSVHGANTFDRGAGMLEFVVGQHGLDEYIDIVTVPTVQMTMSVSASVENFYEIKDAFISSIAGVLGINVNRISIVDVVPGNARRRQRLPAGVPPPVRRLLAGGASVEIELLPEAELSIADAVVWEDEGVVNVTVTRSVNMYPGVAVTVMSMQGNGSTALATAGVHFNQISTVIKILPLERQKTVAIPVHLIPGFSSTNLTFVVRISNAENASITDSSASVTIGNVHSPQPGSPSLSAAASPQKTSNSISIRWSAPEWVNPPSGEWAIIQEYQVQKAVVLSSGSVVPEQDWSTVSEQSGAATALTVSSLEVYTLYKFRVRGRTIKGWTEWSAVSGGIRSLASCGDGKRHASEECDDSNTVDNDGCSSTCAIEDGKSCAGGSETSADTCSSGCGDTQKTPTEECDDGADGDADDGCRSCRIQSGWKCTTNVNGQATSGCTTACGDGIRAGLEACDTNGTVGHGCNADCTLQSGAICVEDEDQLSHCRLCGNGLREEGEVCDDGSADASPGCKNCSAVTAGWSCAGGSYTVPDQCVSGPAIPSSPFATSQTQTSITWKWSAVDGHGLPVSSYVFEYDVNNANGTLRKDPVAVAGTEWTASGLGASDQMSARVKACTAAGCSLFSLFSVPAAVRPPSAAAQLSSIIDAINADPAALLTGTNLSLTAPISVEAPSPEPEAPPNLPTLNMTEILAAAARLAAMNGTVVIEGAPPAPFETSTLFVAATPTPNSTATPTPNSTATPTTPTPNPTPEADSVLVRLVVGLPISLAEFTDDVRLRFRTAIAAAAKVQVWRVFIVSVTRVGTALSQRVLHRRQLLAESLEVAVDIATANATVAINVAAQLTPEVVRANLASNNLPGASLVQLPACSVCCGEPSAFGEWAGRDHPRRCTHREYHHRCSSHGCSHLAWTTDHGGP
jgi:cysteine-rich repeat protein